MAGPNQVNNNPGVQRTTAPVTPQKTGKVSGDPTIAAFNAMNAIEANRTATTSVTNQSLLGGSGPTDGASALTGTSFEGFGVGALGMVDTHMTSMSDGTGATLMTPQDNEAMNSETAATAGRLGEAHQEEVTACLTQFTEIADSVMDEAKKQLGEAIGLTLKSNMKKEAEGTDSDEAALALNGEGGRAFGDFGKLAAQQLQQKGIDFSKMPVEEAVALMFMLISEDAKKDVKNLLIDMNDTTKRKAAMRQAEGLVKGEQDRLRGEANKKWTAMAEPKPAFDEWVATQPIKAPTIQMDPVNGTASIKSPGSLTEGEGSSAQSGVSSGDTIGGNITTFGGLSTDIDTMKDNRDSLSEMGETQQLKMQMYMDRMTKADSANSNLMKKMSDILSGIIGNMK